MSALVTRPDGVYVDATFGRGGHSRRILSQLGAAGRVIAIDRDPEAIAAARDLVREDGRISIFPGSFAAIRDAVRDSNVGGRVAGILLDLGVSSPQLDTPGRGFSFAAEGPLDMRMDPSSGPSAAEWLARSSQAEIESTLRDLGEERYARRIARAIVDARTEGAISTTSQLAALVSRAVPSREPGKHPATRTFQAIRIQVNRELTELRLCLDQVCDLLETAGRLVVISFHSLEDRIVKHFIRDELKGPKLPKGLPVRGLQAAGRLKSLGKPVRPSPSEIAANPRARSAVMRVAERLP